MKVKPVQRSSVALILLACAFLASCDQFLGPARIGVTRTPSGQPVILFAPCPGEPVDRVSLRLVRDNLGGTDDIVLWELVAEPRSVADGLLQAIPGRESPPGFRARVPLIGSLPTTRELTVAIHHPEGAALASSFQLDQLKEGSDPLGHRNVLVPTRLPRPGERYL